MSKNFRPVIKKYREINKTEIILFQVNIVRLERFDSVRLPIFFLKRINILRIQNLMNQNIRGHSFVCSVLFLSFQCNFHK